METWEADLAAAEPAEAPEHDPWSPDVKSRELARLCTGESLFVWGGRFGLVRCLCLLGGRLWEFKPRDGGWNWVTVGRLTGAAGLWGVTYSDGSNAPERVAETPFGGADVLWYAVDFIGYDLGQVWEGGDDDDE